MLKTLICKKITYPFLRQKRSIKSKVTSIQHFSNLVITHCQEQTIQFTSKIRA